jgi:hypothetical protein
VSLPGAEELFRPVEISQSRASDAPQEQDERESGRDGGRPSRRPSRRPSGRVRHDEKMTVYVTAAELLEIEHARLSLRSLHGVAVDRGRLVREAVAMALADLESNGDDSQLVQRLIGR